MLVTEGDVSIVLLTVVSAEVGAVKNSVALRDIMLELEGDDVPVLPEVNVS